MNKLRFAHLMLTPSVTSLLLCMVLAGGVLTISALAYTSENGLLYNYLFGAGSSSQLIETSKSTIEAFSETVFGNPLLNKLLFFGFWMAIGLIVYVTLAGIGAGYTSADNTVQEIRYANSHKKRIDSDLKFRIILRIVALLLWFVYAVFFFKIFVPFSILCGRIAAGTFDQPSGWLYGVLSLLVLTISLHMHVILARFSMLRPRLIGGWDDILESELAESPRF